jgi:uncharacterized protein (UPF0332 family)
MAQAREKLAAGRALLGGEFPGQAVGLAYYAMLYAARAALSESERTAKTHRGTWNLFQAAYVDSGRFDQELLRQARASQRTREASDYDAGQISAEEATKLMELGERFVAAVEGMLTEDSQ